MITRMAAIGLLENQRGEVLLVNQTAKNGMDYWTLPGGKCEGSEFLFETLEREFREETSLKIFPPYEICYTAQCRSHEIERFWTTVVFKITKYEGILSTINDPESAVRDVRFFKKEDAIKEFKKYQPFRIMKDPTLNYLENGKENLTWFFEHWSSDRDELYLNGKRP